MTPSLRSVFIRRLSSTVILWGVALWIIFAGFEVGFFLLIGAIGLLGLWEFYRMLDHKKLPNFKILGMICAVIFIWELSLLLQGRPAPLLRLRSGGVFFPAHGVCPADVRADARYRPVETMAYTLFGFIT